MADAVNMQAGGMLLELSRAPSVLAVLGRIVAAAVAVSVAFLFAPWQQVAPASGKVLAYAPGDRQQVVQAPVAGRVVRVLVQEGQRVEANEPLVDIMDVDPAMMQRLNQEVQALALREAAALSREEGATARAESLESAVRAAVEGAQSRVRMAQERQTATHRALDAAQATELTAQLNLTRQVGLHAEGLVSKRALELAQLEAARARAELERARAAVRAAEDEVSSLKADATRIHRQASAGANGARASAASARSEIAATRAEQARLSVRVSRQESQLVRAPRAGQVLRVITSQGGAMVKPGDALLILVPDTQDRAVEIRVDGLHAPLLQEGAEVRIQFEGWPAVQVSGWPDLAVGTFVGRVAFVDDADDGRGQFRALITPDANAPRWPEPSRLRQGVRAQAFVLLNRVSVGFELWRQINGFPPLATASPPTKDKT